MKIVLSIALTLFLFGCSDNAESSSAKKEATAVVVEQAKIVSEESVKQVQETTQKVMTEVKNVSAEGVAQVEVKATEVMKEAPSIVKPVVAESTVDGKAIYTKCVGCHGSHGERKALGKSQLIQGWKASETVAALNGYKDGSYGSSMKGVMKSQIAKLSEEEISAVAEYLSQQ